MDTTRIIDDKPAATADPLATLRAELELRRTSFGARAQKTEQPRDWERANVYGDVLSLLDDLVAGSTGLPEGERTYRVELTADEIGALLPDLILPDKTFEEACELLDKAEAKIRVAYDPELQRRMEEMNAEDED